MNARVCMAPMPGRGTYAVLAGRVFAEECQQPILLPRLHFGRVVQRSNTVSQVDTDQRPQLKAWICKHAPGEVNASATLQSVACESQPKHMSFGGPKRGVGEAAQLHGIPPMSRVRKCVLELMIQPNISPRPISPHGIHSQSPMLLP